MDLSYIYRMPIGNVVFVISLTIYTMATINLMFNKVQQKEDKTRMKRADELRAKKIKTIEEQKELISLLYPKPTPRKWSLEMILLFILNIIKYLIIYSIIAYLIYLSRIKIELWGAILWLFLISLSYSFVLKKIGFQQKGMDISEMVKFK